MEQAEEEERMCPRRQFSRRVPISSDTDILLPIHNDEPIGHNQTN